MQGKALFNSYYPVFCTKFNCDLQALASAYPSESEMQGCLQVCMQGKLFSFISVDKIVCQSETQQNCLKIYTNGKKFLTVSIDPPSVPSYMSYSKERVVRLIVQLVIG